MFDEKTGIMVSKRKYFEKIAVTPLNKTTAKENLLLLKKIFDKHKIDFRISHGTLLGALREKDFISDDCDTDFSLLKSEKWKVRYCLIDLDNAGFCRIRRLEDLWSFERKGVYTDLYFFEQKTLIDVLLNRVLCKHRHWCLRMSRACFTGHCFVYFLGKMFKTFPNPEAWVCFVYGKTWKVPQKRKGNTRTFTSKCYRLAGRILKKVCK